MERRVVIAAVLSVVVLVAWSWLFPPQKRDPAQAPIEASPEAGAREITPSTIDPAPVGETPADPTAPPSEAQTNRVAATDVREVRVETDLYDIVLTNAGARALSWRLRDYKTGGGDPLELLPQFVESEPELLALESPDPLLAQQLNEALYQVESTSIDGGERVRFTWADGRGVEARKTLTFHHGSYLVDVDVDVTQLGRRMPVGLVLGPGFGAQEPSDIRSTYYYDSQGVMNAGGNVRRFKKRKLVGDPGAVAASLQWAGFEDQYFAALVLPGREPTEVAWQPVELTRQWIGEDPSGVNEPEEEPLLAVALPTGEALLYVGPKKYTELRETGHQLEKVVWFASNPFLAWIARFIFLCLIWIHDHTIANYGLAIMLSTFMLRLLLFPVNQYSMVSMKKTQQQMAKLQPKIKAIRNKYKKSKDAESRNQMNQEMMALYKREGVNPMGGLSGCLPMLAQLPILIGFYNMLTVAVELRGAPFFGWIHDLSRSDPYWVTPLLMGATMFLQQKMAMSKIKDPQQLQQQRFMMFMPVVFTYICLQMPSGMVLYWFMNNLLGMGQQYLVNRHTSRLETAEQKA